jgi:hypothetical protein
MNLTKSKLKNIINEELRTLLNERKMATPAQDAAFEAMIADMGWAPPLDTEYQPEYRPDRGHESHDPYAPGRWPGHDPDAEVAEADNMPWDLGWPEEAYTPGTFVPGTSSQDTSSFPGALHGREPEGVIRPDQRPPPPCPAGQVRRHGKCVQSDISKIQGAAIKRHEKAGGGIHTPENPTSAAIDRRMRRGLEESQYFKHIINEELQLLLKEVYGDPPYSVYVVHVAGDEPFLIPQGEYDSGDLESAKRTMELYSNNARAHEVYVLDGDGRRVATMSKGQEEQVI